MNICRLHQQGNQDALLFLAGWGMCPEPFQDIPAGSLDVFMISDYRSMEGEELASFLKDLQEKTPYKKFHLLAWSMGVWVAAMLATQKTFSALPLASAIAIGGTCHPIDNRRGIPEQNFADMAKHLTPAGVQEFQRSMFADTEEADRFTTSFRKGDRPFKEIHQELRALAKASAHQAGIPDIYTSRIVTGRDRIFPARNQVRAWGRHTCRTLSLPHFPFYHWSSWSAMVEAFT
ncbi:MAG: DUF452 family protein [Candidatus Electrothrix sp. ATG2]|nr:DUF452 family protein [Candidatus Electrothrix sp. ATG2]